MSKVIYITKHIGKCNECPYFHEHVDTSVCEDSFDEPNYDFYCQHKKADNSGTAQEKHNTNDGKWIGCALSRFDKDCDIPKWCPLDDETSDMD